jgi:hypothetical protein
VQLFDMTRAEVGLVVFIFVLIYAAGLLPRFINFLAALTGAGGRENDREK